MTAPHGYTPSVDFDEEEADQTSGRSTIRTSALDIELDAISLSITGLITNLSLIQRDDGLIRDQAVDVFNLTTAVLALMGSAGFTVHNPIGWLTAIAYPARDIVTHGTGTYVSAVAHTSGVFATDLAAGKWALLFDSAAFAAASVTFTPGGTISAGNVQAAILEAAAEAMQIAQNGADINNVATFRSNLSVQSKAEDQKIAASYCQAAGTLDAITGAFTPTITTLANPLLLFVEAAGANSAVAPTFAADGTGNQIIVKGSNQPLTPGDIPGANYLMMLYNDVSLARWVLLNPAYPVSSATVSTTVAVPVRQTVLQGPLTAGVPSALAAGAGLTGDLKATALAVYLAFANGFSTTNGAVDFVESVTADQASYWAALQASNTSYVGVTRASAGNLAAFKTLAPFQWRDTYDRTAQSVLQFGGVAGATVFLDDFGNTWAAAGGAKVQTNQVKFGTGGLGGAGAVNVTNGTTDYVTSTSFTTLGTGGWSLRCWAYITSLAAVNTLIDFTNAGAFGAQLKVTAAGKVTYNLSSTGAANDIAAAPVAGAATITVNGWHFYELTYDALAGVYRCYVDGVQDQSTASALKICIITHANFGGLLSNLTGLVGYMGAGTEFLPYCDHPAGTAYAAPTGAPSISAAGYASDWIDTQQWKVKSPSAASAAAATDPTFGASNKVYVGEFDTGAAAVSASRTYAYRGEFISALNLVTLGTTVSVTHNLGMQPRRIRNVLVNQIPEGIYLQGDEVDGFQTFNGGDNRGYVSKTTKSGHTYTIASAAISLFGAVGGTVLNITNANWRMKSYISRGV